MRPDHNRRGSEERTEGDDGAPQEMLKPFEMVDAARRLLGTGSYDGREGTTTVPDDAVTQRCQAPQAAELHPNVPVIDKVLQVRVR